MRSHRLRLLPLAAAALLALARTTPSHAQVVVSDALTGPVVERGTFRVSKLQQPVGEQTYQVVRDGRSLVLTTTSEHNFIGSEAKLEATLRARLDGTPERYEVSGATSTMTSVDAAVTVEGRRATIREGGRSRTEAVPARFFTLTHYPPVAVEQALFRYWERQGRPERIPLLPAGEARITRRGVDTVQVGERRVGLDRWAVHGVVWGIQSAWTDSAGTLVAAVSADAELDRWEAVRAGFDVHLPLFVRRSVEDGIAEVEAAARRIRPQAEGAFAIVGARLIDGTGRAPVDDAVVLVQGGVIAAAGPRASVTIPDGTRLIDGSGRTVLPGLWDMHGHYEQVEWPAVGLASGVTTVREPGNEPALAVALRDAIDAGRVLGPRMLLAGVVDGGEHPLGTVTPGTPDEAREAVRRYHAEGYRQIKIYQNLPPALVPVVAEEAHRLGMTVTGHVPTGMTALEFVRAGADQINHVAGAYSSMRAPAPAGQRPPPLDTASAEARAAIAFFRERGTVIDPSLARWEQHLHVRGEWAEPGLAKVPVELAGALASTGVEARDRERAAASLGVQHRVTKALHDAGVPIVLGTDLTVPGHSIHRELELAVQAGLTPMEAIQAATIVPARAMGLGAESGTVEAGKRADLVIIEGDPLANISAIRSVRGVVARGRLYDPAPLWESAGFRP